MLVLGLLVASTVDSMTLRTLYYGNCGRFLITGNAGFISSTVVRRVAGLTALIDTILSVPIGSIAVPFCGFSFWDPFR